MIIAFLLLLSLSAFFSGSETALFSLSRARLISFRKSPDITKRTAAKLLKSYHYTLIALILGNMFVNVALSMVNAELLERFGLGATATSILSGCVAVVVLLIFGEITPKTFAMAHCEKVSLACARPVMFFCRVLRPVIVVSDRIFSFVLDLLGREKQKALDPEEYASFLEIAGAGGAFSDSECKLLLDTFELHNKVVAEVMTGRMELKIIKESFSAADCEEMIRSSHHLFLPVSETELEECEKILDARKFFALGKEQRECWSKSAAVFRPTIIPENSKLTLALGSMRKNEVSAALAVDEYGRISGMLYEKNVFSELLGSLADDYGHAQHRYYRQIAEDVWLFNGMAPLYILEEIKELKLPDKLEANNFNGLFCDELGRLPVLGDEIEFCGFTLRADGVAKHRVSKVHAVFTGGGES